MTFPYWPCTVLACAFLAYRAWKDVAYTAPKVRAQSDALDILARRVERLEDAKPTITADDLAKLVTRVNAITQDALELKEEYRKFKASMLLGGGPKKRDVIGG